MAHENSCQRRMMNLEKTSGTSIQPTNCNIIGSVKRFFKSFVDLGRVVYLGPIEKTKRIVKRLSTETYFIDSLATTLVLHKRNQLQIICNSDISVLELKQANSSIEVSTQEALLQSQRLTQLTDQVESLIDGLIAAAQRISLPSSPFSELMSMCDLLAERLMLLNENQGSGVISKCELEDREPYELNEFEGLARKFMVVSGKCDRAIKAHTIETAQIYLATLGLGNLINEASGGAKVLVNQLTSTSELVPLQGRSAMKLEEVFKHMKSSAIQSQALVDDFAAAASQLFTVSQELEISIEAQD